MITTAEKATVGAFVVATGLLVAAGLFLLWGVNAGKPVKRYFVLFDESVAGLLPGSSVKYLGLDVGKVDAMSIDEGPPVRIRVRVAIDPKTPVKIDTRAQLVGQGLTGVRYLELMKGTDPKDRDPETPIPEQASQWVDMVDRLTKISEAVSALLDQQNRGELTKALKNANAFLEAGTSAITSTQAGLERIVTRVEALVEEERVPIRELIASARSTLAKVDAAIDEKRLTGLVDDLGAAARDVRALVNTVDAAAKDARSTVQAANVPATVAEIRSATGAARVAVEQLRGAVPRVEDDLVKMGRLLDDLRSAARTLDGLAREVRDRPSLLIRDLERPRRTIPDRD